MNSRTLVLVIFAIWTIICWRWYVCGIKDMCSDRLVLQEQVIETPALEPDTIAATTEPLPTTPPPPVTYSRKKPAPMTSDIDRVQMEEVKDHMSIYFPFNSIRKEDNAAINEYLSDLAAELIRTGGKVTIDGHADFVGDSKTNIAFGRQRAAGIRNILIKKGVSKSQIRIRSYGSSRPIGSNDNPQGRYRNRRVEIKVQ